MTKPTTKTKTRPLDKKTAAVQAASIAVILFVAWLIWSRTQPERLLNSDLQESSATVFRGELYEIANTRAIMGNSHVGGLGKQPDAMIVARPVAGGPERVVVNEGPLSSFDYGGGPGSFSICAANRSLYYVLRPIIKGSSIGGGASDTRYLGEFAASKKNLSQTVKGSAKLVKHNGPDPYAVAANLGRAAVSGGLATAVGSPQSEPVAVSIGGVVNNTRLLGEYAASKNAAPGTTKASAKKVVRYVQRTFTVSTQIHRVAAAGGRANEVAAIPSNNVAILGQQAFWIRSKPEVVLTITEGNTERTEVTANSDLMWTDMETHSERCVRKGVSAITQLKVGEFGAFWTEPHPFPDDRKDLFYVRAADGAMLRLGILEANSAVACSVEWKGSVYWFVNWQNNSAGQPKEPGRLIAIDLDGTHLRTVAQLQNSNRVSATGQKLFGYHNSLCAVLSNVTEFRAHSPILSDLVQVQVGAPGATRVIQRLPPNASAFSFDADYLYFHVPTTDRSLLATILDEHQDEHSSDTLYRIRLPD